jgi:hypothetical protein
VSSAPSAVDLARDELFQHIIRCDVIGAEPEHQTEWFNETMAYMADRWHELSPKQVAELRTLGERFAQPARSAAPAETTPDEVVPDEGVRSESDEASLDTVSA